MHKKLSFLIYGWEHKKKENKQKKESLISEKCECGSGSFLVQKKYRKEKIVCRRCGKEIKKEDD